MTDPRSRILSRACDLYLAEGLEGFSMRKLARMVGVTAPALYRHFDSREEVILALVAEAHRVLGQYLYRALSGRTPIERMRLAGQGYLDFALENPRLYDMLYLSPAVFGLEDYPDEVATQACSTGQFWLDRVRESVDAGILRPGDLDQIGVTLWAHAHGLISLYLQGSLPMPEEAFRELYQASGRRIALGLATPEWIGEQARMEEQAPGTQSKAGGAEARSPREEPSRQEEVGLSVVP